MNESISIEDAFAVTVKLFKENQEKLKKLEKENALLRECVEFYAQGGNTNKDIWEHKELGYFTGKRAREVLNKLRGR